MNQIKFLTAVMLLAVMLIMTFSPIAVYAFGNDVINVQVGDNGALGVTGNAFQDTRAEAWNTLIMKLKGFVAGFAGIAAVYMVGIMITKFIALAASSGNPQARNQALVGILWSGAATAGLGSVAVFVGFFYKAL